MNWSDVGAIIGKTAPLLGTLLGGPAGGAVGAIIAAALGTDSTPDSVAKAVQSDPQAALKLAEIQSTERVELQRLLIHAEGQRLTAETATFQAEIDDKKSARARDVRFVETGQINWRANVMLGLVFASIIAIVWILVGYKVDGNTAVGGALIALLGTLGGCIKDAFGFEFGSSRGSMMKDMKIEAMMRDGVR
jgi:hypothetical protein